MFIETLTMNSFIAHNVINEVNTFLASAAKYGGIVYGKYVEDIICNKKYHFDTVQLWFTNFRNFKQIPYKNISQLYPIEDKKRYYFYLEKHSTYIAKIEVVFGPNCPVKSHHLDYMSDIWGLIPQNRSNVYFELNEKITINPDTIFKIFEQSYYNIIGSLILNGWSLHLPNDNSMLGRFRKWINCPSININNYPSHANSLKMYLLGWNEHKKSQDSKLYKIGQYNRSGRRINIWLNIDEASEMTDVDKKSILSCCQEKILQTGGYTWKFLP